LREVFSSLLKGQWLESVSGCLVTSIGIAVVGVTSRYGCVYGELEGARLAKRECESCTGVANDEKELGMGIRGPM
jgi:hypothetical protein